MSVKSREKIALAVFAALIVLSLLGLGWYLVAGHSWNVAASNIDDTFGSMDGYTAIVYEGTAVPQTAAEKAAEAAKEEKAAKGAAGSASSDEKESHELDPAADDDEGMMTGIGKALEHHERDQMPDMHAVARRIDAAVKRDALFFRQLPQPLFICHLIDGAAPRQFINDIHRIRSFIIKNDKIHFIITRPVRSVNADPL